MTGLLAQGGFLSEVAALLTAIAALIGAIVALRKIFRPPENGGKKTETQKEPTRLVLEGKCLAEPWAYDINGTLHQSGEQITGEIKWTITKAPSLKKIGRVEISQVRGSRLGNEITVKEHQYGNPSSKVLYSYTFRLLENNRFEGTAKHLPTDAGGNMAGKYEEKTA